MTSRRTMMAALIALGLAGILATGCRDDAILYPPVAGEGAPPVSFTLPKWYGGHPAAISITIDFNWGTGGDTMRQIRTNQHATLARRLVLDYHVVTAAYEPFPEYRDELLGLKALGIHFFGHGHEHSLHDELTYDECLASFTTCFDLMEEWHLEPKTYAYPNGSGREAATQLALARSGFMCGRNFEPKTEDKYICADDATEPENWFFLPSIPLASEYDPSVYVTSHAEMETFLATAVEKTAWIIPCYHAIGLPGSWGYYPYDDYLADLDSIVEKEYWCANMDVVACYIRERNALAMTIVDTRTKNGQTVVEVSFDDGLPDDVYDVPVSVDLTLDVGYRVTEVTSEPPIGWQRSFIPEDGAIRINVIPDGATYTLTLGSRVRPE